MFFPQTKLLTTSAIIAWRYIKGPRSALMRPDASSRQGPHGSQVDGRELCTRLDRIRMFVLVTRTMGMLMPLPSVPPPFLYFG